MTIEAKQQMKPIAPTYPRGLMTHRYTWLVAPLLFCACSRSSPSPPERIGVAAAPLQVCITSRDGVLGDQRDSTIDQDEPTTNFGGSIELETEVGTPAKAALLWIDVSWVPVGATIDSATLTLVPVSKTGTGMLEAYPMTASWGETTATWTSKNAAIGSLVDDVTVPSTTLDPVELDLTSLVDDWVSGAAANYGIQLRQDANATVWRSTEAALVYQRPSLRVCYTSPSTCFNLVKDGSETGINCGGPCAPCTCRNNVQNGIESGVDCGGSCLDGCPSCSDGVQNQEETGVDCGGPCGVCPACTHSECTYGAPLATTCSTCTADVCDENPFCCKFRWSNACIDLAASLCGTPTCAASCGNGFCDPEEECVCSADCGPCKPADSE